MPPPATRSLPGSLAWAALTLLSGPLLAQNPLDLELLAGGQVGAPAVFEVGGQDPLALLPKVLVFDVSRLTVGLPLPPFGNLLLPLSPLALAVSGGPGNGYLVPINSQPGLAGLTVFAQALGPVAGQPFGTLGLSDLETFTLVNSPPVVRLVYSLAALDTGLSAEVYDSLAKRLAPCGYAALPETPGALACSPDGRFAFVSLPSAGQLRSFRSSSTCGELVGTGNSVIDPGTNLLAVDPLGRFLFAASPQTDRLMTLRLDLLSGAPSPSGLTNVPSFQDPIALWVSPKGQQLYALSAATSELRSFVVQGNDGALSLQQTLSVPSGSSRLLVAPGGALVVVIAPQAQVLRVFTRDLQSGQLTPLASGIQSLGFAVAGAALEDAGGGGLLHLSDPIAGEIKSFNLLAGSGLLQPTSPASLVLGSAPGELLLDSGGGALFASVPAEAELNTLPLSASRLPTLGARLRGRGAISALGASRGLQPLIPRSRTAVLASEATAELRVFQFSPSNGKLVPTGGGLSPTGPGPVGVSIAPDNGLVVSANLSGSTITGFLLNSATSQLGAGQSQPAAGPFEVAFEPSGRFAYVTNSGNSSLQIFARQGLQLVAQSSLALPANSVPRGLAFDPSGRFLFVALSLSNQVAAYRVNSTNGSLSLVALTALSGGPFDVCVHPSGRFLYVALSSAGQVKAFAIDPFDGNLAQLSSNSTGVGALPTVLTTDPTGRRLFCANSNGDSVSVLNINSETGELSAASGSPLLVLDDPRGLAVDATGSVLLVVNRALDLVQAFSIPVGDSALTGLSLSSTGGDAPRGIALDLLWE